MAGQLTDGNRREEIILDITKQMIQEDWDTKDEELQDTLAQKGITVPLRTCRVLLESERSLDAF